MPEQGAGETARWLRSLGSLQGTPPPFTIAAAPDHPVPLFRDWMHAAAQSAVPEPAAVTLSTVDAEGMPDARTLILKDFTASGRWAVAGPRSSGKAAQLAAHPVAALSFWWQPIMRAVRMRGPIVEGTSDEIAADLAARPVRGGVTVDEWMVWWVDAVRVEFWQGAEDRNHLRLVYERVDGVWRHGLHTPGGAGRE